MKEKGMLKNIKLSYLITIFVLIILLVTINIFPINSNNSKRKESLSKYCSVERISELSTLKGSFHNVAVFEKGPEGIEKDLSSIILWPFDKIIRPGYKHFWIEYDGITIYGVNANNIQINDPDSNGIVDVYVPDAEVFNVTAEKESMSEPISDNGFLVQITANDKSEAYAEAQAKMKEEAEKDQALLNRAKSNVKALLEKYIINVGDGIGEKYTVNWIDSPRQK